MANADFAARVKTGHTELQKIMGRDMPREVEAVPHAHMENYAPPAERDRLHKLADELDRAALDEIKYRFKRLTFDEMIELSEGISADPAKISSWAKSTA